MLIVCPTCAREYRIDPEHIGAQGRAVRCAECRETWSVIVPAETGDDPEAEMEQPSPGDERPPTPPLDDVPAPPTLEAQSDPSASDGAITVAATTRRSVPRSARRAPRRVARRPVLPRIDPRRIMGRPPAAVLAIAGVLIIAGGLAFRTSVVRALPQSARLYAAIGLPVNLRGLEFREVRADLTSGEDGAVLVVEGEIANARATDTDVPSLAISVRGSGGQTLYGWTKEAPRPTLGPAESVRFRARLASPPDEGRQVLVMFAPTDRGPGAAAPGAP